MIACSPDAVLEISGAAAVPYLPRTRDLLHGGAVGGWIMVKLGDWLSEGINMLREQMGAWVLVALVFILLSLSIYTCIGFFLLAGVLFFGPHAVALRQLRGGRVEIGDMFSTFSLILPGLGFIGLMILLFIPSMLLFGLPMLFIAPLLMFVPHLVTDRRMGLIEAVKASAAVVRQDYWWFFLANLVIGFIAGVGTYLCYVGILLSLPLYYTMLAVAYRDCFGIEDALSFKSEDTRPEPEYDEGHYGAA